MSLTQAVKLEARRLGFQLVGITTPDPPPHFDVYERWLEAGRHGEMGYLATSRARQRRADPRMILPECHSILVLGIRYPVPNQNSLKRGEGPVQGRIASYAWGDDYHGILPRRLQVLVEFINAQVGHTIPNRWYTDTGPVLERDLAQRAGLGWIGKNTCLIHPRLGSYFLLAEILLGVELEPDPPFALDFCGACTRCLETCPTGCILPGRTLDATRCISYLTIELKGPIPSDLRPQMGDWVFGCDICQEVCPWNKRFAVPGGDPAFGPRSGVPHPNLILEILLTPMEFNRKLKGSPIQLTKRRGYLRNVAVAIGNSHSPTVVPALAQALLHDPEPLVRGHAAWALGCIGGGAARQTLGEAAGVERDVGVLYEIHAALDQET
jgi:epoxyqueuosine reductase